MFKKLTILALALVAAVSCKKEYIEVPVVPTIQYDTTITTLTHQSGTLEFLYEDVLLCNEGSWQSDNGQLSKYNSLSNSVTNKWFQAVNGTKLGDTPNDIIRVNDNLVAIAINWSNILQFITNDGVAVGYVEVANNRRLAKDNNGNLYITSYAHQCGDQTFTKGFVAKIAVNEIQNEDGTITLDPKVVATVEVGWEPEGIQFYDGKLFVANTGGYAFSEGHDYENSISVIDAASMIKIQDVELVNDAGQRVINLYGTMSQAGKYLCINSPGDYYEIPAQSVIFNCADLSYQVLDFPVTYNTSDGVNFYTVGSSFSYTTYDYEYYINTIDPENMFVTEGILGDDVTEVIKSMTAPYDVYISPYTRNFYATDAKSYASAGNLFVFNNLGRSILSKEKVYVCPAHMVAIPHYTESTETYTEVTQVITPIITYPTKSSRSVSINDLHRQKFVEAWTAATNKQ